MKILPKNLLFKENILTSQFYTIVFPLTTINNIFTARSNQICITFIHNNYNTAYVLRNFAIDHNYVGQHNNLIKPTHVYKDHNHDQYLKKNLLSINNL